MNFTAALDSVSYRGLFYKLKSIGVGGQFLFVISESLSDRRQHLRLNFKVSVSVNVVSGVPQGSVLELLLFILYTCELFHIVRNHIVRYANDTTIYAVIPRPLSRPHVGTVESRFSNNQLPVFEIAHEAQLRRRNPW